MSLPLCLPDLIEQGKLGKRQAEEAQAIYDRHYRRLEREMGPAAAASEATRRALDEMDYAVKLKARRAGQQVKTRQRILADMASLSDDPYHAATKVLASGSGRNILNVEAQAKAIAGRIHGRMEGVLRRHSRNLLGEARDKSGLNDLVRERFGEATGNRSAKELADAFGEAAEYARQRFNEAGGSIAHRNDWGLPQAHDNMKVRAAGWERWRDAVLPRLAIERMIDNATGQPFTAETLTEALREVWQSIRSDGWSKAKPDARPGHSSLAAKRSDARFLVFKSADDWMAYQAEFGTGTAFDAMMGHVEGMARDIAMMEVMGPDPRGTLDWMKEHIQRTAALDEDPGPGVLDRARSAALSLDQLYDTVSGRMNDPVNAGVARTMGGVRSFLTSAFLGSASLSATTDVGFQAVTRAYNGLPTTGAITGYLKLFASRADRRVAVRLGLIAEEASQMAATLNRYVDGTRGPELAMRLSDAVLRLSGLSVWTQVGKWAFGMETLGHLADVRGQAWGALDPALRDMMARYGIDEGGWNTIRGTETYKHKGAEFLRPDDVADQALGDRMLRMVLTETDYAVPSATARAKATLSFGQQPGTLGGELIRNGALFKSFGVSMVLTHGARMMEQQGWNRAKYFAGLTITTTLLGALASQLREVAQGRDPKDMTTAAFWGNAVLTGGGYGIFGDLIGSATQRDRYDRGFAEMLAGPVVSAAGDVIRAVKKPIYDALDDEKEAQPGTEAVKLFKRYLPGQSLWYARLAFNRLVADQLQREIDPDYDLSWQRMEDAAAEQGQDYWWRPGQLTPDRTPELAERPPE